MIHNNYHTSKHISMNVMLLLCDYAITLDITVDSVQFCHLSTNLYAIYCTSLIGYA